ncbi:SpoIIE family protein phosphatase [Calothrix sp. PCC 6303]|uniref:SpoIIE family protein phosphatase n=1 Tax=Calothrix sp. PCC 6303 TaxID=1170562 RepID=UPI0002A05701|nr:SpoIIE family protein phosphatase [Calothrix sp. PCC 6303]AFZ03010.1 response regulator receiver modulated serine phosphatase [Calothrix sp. PCC 6303]
MVKIVIIDDDPIVRTVLKRTLENQGYQVTIASNGEEGIRYAKEIQPALIICDWMMSCIDGLEVCRRIKAEPELSTTFFILLTAKGAQRGEEEDRVRGLDAGADEFISKPIEMNELKARVRAGLRLNQLHEDLKGQKQTLEVLNKNLREELAEAADYVQSLLPSPLTGKVNTDTLFIPSAQLGGDCFDYYWIDDDNLVIYLLDVSGHGVGSALLSVSVLNLLRSQSLLNTDFRKPGEVLKTLNQNFQMSAHGDKYFTIWYGVYNYSTRQLIYASAGHPSGVLLHQTSNQVEVKRLGSLDLPIGFLLDINFEEMKIDIVQNSSLYIFSDGAYEILQPDGQLWSIDAFIDLLLKSYQDSLDDILDKIKWINSLTNFDDDLSLLRIKF